MEQKYDINVKIHVPHSNDPDLTMTRFFFTQKFNSKGKLKMTFPTRDTNKELRIKDSCTAVPRSYSVCSWER